MEVGVTRNEEHSNHNTRGAPSPQAESRAGERPRSAGRGATRPPRPAPAPTFPLVCSTIRAPQSRGGGSNVSSDASEITVRKIENALVSFRESAHLVPEPEGAPGRRCGSWICAPLSALATPAALAQRWLSGLPPVRLPNRCHTELSNKVRNSLGTGRRAVYSEARVGLFGSAPTNAPQRPFGPSWRAPETLSAGRTSIVRSDVAERRGPVPLRVRQLPRPRWGSGSSRAAESSRRR